jgi:hypothetical protein
MAASVRPCRGVWLEPQLSRGDTDGAFSLFVVGGVISLMSPSRAAPQFYLIDIVIPFDGSALAQIAHAIVFSVTVGAIAASALIAIHVARCAYVNTFDSLWPIKALRLAVTVLVTTFFVPAFSILLTPYSCLSMRMYYGADYTCTAATLVSMSIVATFAIIALVTLGLSSALVFRDSDPTSNDPEARRSGIVGFAAVLTQIIIIILREAPDVVPPEVFLGVMCALYFLLALSIARTLPYFRPVMNSFRVRVRGGCCCCCCDCAVAAAATASAAAATLYLRYCERAQTRLRAVRAHAVRPLPLALAHLWIRAVDGAAGALARAGRH